MGIKEYKTWREGYVEGINLCGDFLKVLENVEDKELRRFIMMLKEQWSNYGKWEEDGNHKNDD